MMQTRRGFIGLLTAISSTPVWAKIKERIPVRVTYLEASQDGGLTWNTISRVVGPRVAMNKATLRSVNASGVTPKTRVRVAFEPRGEISKTDAARARYKAVS